jgi:hypothetical protein
MTKTAWLVLTLAFSFLGVTTACGEENGGGVGDDAGADTDIDSDADSDTDTDTDTDSDPDGGADTDTETSTEGEIWVLQDALLASDGADGDHFGRVVAIGGGTILVGAPDAVGVGTGIGAVYVFVQDGGDWTEQAILQASDGDADDGYAESIAVDGDVAMVGAPSHDEVGLDVGAVYVYERTGTAWAEAQELVPELELPVEADYHFGISVAIDGDTAIIGATGIGEGAAYVFTRDEAGWVQSAKLLPDLVVDSMGFGMSVDIDGVDAVVGSHGGGAAGEQTAAAYAFVGAGSTWLQTAKLPPDGAANDIGFARSLALSQGTAIVGMWSVDDWDSYYAGAAVVYAQSGEDWTEGVGLYGSECDENDCYFGWSVSIDGDAIAVGGDGTNHNTGAAYVFRRTDGVWGDGETLLPDGIDEGDHFGWSVAIEGNTLVAGAPSGTAEAGTVYIFVEE